MASRQVRRRRLVASVVLAVDPMAFTVEDDQLRVALWRRLDEPFQGRWALPGVFYNPGEGLEGAARRGLQAKAHLLDVGYIEQLFTWDHADRDPRGRVIVVAYYALVEPATLRAAMAGHEDVCLARVHVPWPRETGGRVRLFDQHEERVEIAFDHDEILGLAVKRLRAKLEYTDQALHLLPERFTLREMQQVYETVLGRTLNTDSFRRSVTKTARLVTPTGSYVPVGDSRRVAELYRPTASDQERRR